MKKIKSDLAYKLINHGPLLIVSAAFENKETFTPIAWNMPVENNPNLIAITVSKENFLNNLIKKSKEFCLNILDIKFSDEVIKFGSSSGADTNKLINSNLSAAKCSKINCRFIKQAEGIIECKLNKNINIGGVNIFIGEVLNCKVSDAFKNNSWDLTKIKTIHHLGSGKFCTIKNI